MRVEIIPPEEQQPVLPPLAADSTRSRMTQFGPAAL
jgi:hypothetical protein